MCASPLSRKCSHISPVRSLFLMVVGPKSAKKKRKGEKEHIARKYSLLGDYPCLSETAQEQSARPSLLNITCACEYVCVCRGVVVCGLLRLIVRRTEELKTQAAVVGSCELSSVEFAQ